MPPSSTEIIKPIFLWHFFRSNLCLSWGLGLLRPRSGIEYIRGISMVSLLLFIQEIVDILNILLFFDPHTLKEQLTAGKKELRIVWPISEMISLPFLLAWVYFSRHKYNCINFDFELQLYCPKNSDLSLHNPVKIYSCILYLEHKLNMFYGCIKNYYQMEKTMSFTDVSKITTSGFNSNKLCKFIHSSIII